MTAPQLPRYRRALAQTLGCAAFLSVPLMAQTDGASPQPIAQVEAHIPGGVRGADVSAARVVELAESYGLDVAELQAILLRDDDIVVSPENRLAFVDRGLHAPHTENENSGRTAPPPGVPTSEAFLLHSRPGSEKTIYLDFNGHHSVDNFWEHDIVFPAYDTDGDDTNFSEGELSDIIAWWRFVSEDFAPFDVNITTQDPGLDAILRTDGSDTEYGTRCLMTQYTDGFGEGTGGIAFLFAFGLDSDNPAFVFNKSINAGSMSASHEVGHNLGLFHDGLDDSSYHPGTGSGDTSWGPIMGAPFSSNLVQWSNGDYSGSTTTEDDLDIIISSPNNLTWLADDHGDTAGTASAMTPDTSCPAEFSATAEGMLADRFDLDAHSFVHHGGVVDFEARPLEPGGNLDISMELFDANDVSLATVNPSEDLNALLSIDLAPGEYRIVLEGVGKPGEYSDYSTIGQYTLTAAGDTSGLIALIGDGLAGTAGLTPDITVIGSTCAGDAVSLQLSNAKANSAAFLLVATAELGVPFKGGVLTPDITGPSAVLNKLTDGAGATNVDTTWPVGLPSGASIYFQYWVTDAGGPVGFSSSQGLSMTQP
ncbi:MAG: hypothetical protein DHS20C15_10520 [Planctomycetota bacterium]|nr:MAG: hypothetical protein DHS20C15_10520 [Planctomycetota bacterium]